MTEQSQEESSRHSRRDGWLGVIVFSAAALCAAIWLLDLGRGLTFFFDEWDFIEAAGTSGYWHNVLQPHNGHPSMIPFSMYEVLLHTVGLRHYWPYQLILVLLDVGCGLLLFLLLRRKLHPVLAAAASAVLMLLGPAWQDLLWPFQFGFLGSVAGGLGALVFLDRGTRRADIGACICLVASVACSGVGLPFAVGVMVELAWRRQSWRRLWIPAIPLALFVVWYETIGKSATSSSLSPGSVVRSIGSDTATTVGALVGRGSTVGAVLTGVLAAAIVVAVVRSPGRAARLAMATSGLVAFWLLTLLARGVSQDSASRYLYPAAALVLVATGELPTLVSRRDRGRHAAGIPAWTAHLGAIAVLFVVAFAALAIWWNAAPLASSATNLNGVSAQVETELRAVTLAGSALPATFQPNGSLMPQVTVGPYLKSVAAFGSPGGSLTNAPDPLGSIADAMLLRGRPMEVSAGDPDSSPPVGKDCQRSALGPNRPNVSFTLSQRGSVITAPRDAAIALRVKSFAATFPAVPLTTISQGETVTLKWSPLPTRIRWTFEVTPLPAPAPAGSVVTVCPEIAAGSSSGT